MEGIRKPIGKMAYRSRQNGLSALERVEVKEHWEVIFGLLTALMTVAMIDNPMYDQIVAGGIVLATALMTQVMSLMVYQKNPHEIIDKVITNYNTHYINYIIPVD